MFSTNSLGGYELQRCCTELLSLLFQKSLSKSLKRHTYMSVEHQPSFLHQSTHSRSPDPGQEVKEERNSPFIRRCKNSFMSKQGNKNRADASIRQQSRNERDYTCAFISFNKSIKERKREIKSCKASHLTKTHY